MREDNVWRITSLFNDFIKMKYLYKIDKISPQPSPRNVKVMYLDLIGFKRKNNEFFFNWQNIDLLVNFS